eukprot:scaffold225868_cov35-Tisochrysis_lutea.AAC.2
MPGKGRPPLPCAYSAGCRRPRAASTPSSPPMHNSVLTLSQLSSRAVPCPVRPRSCIPYVVCYSNAAVRAAVAPPSTDRICTSI